MNKAFSKVLVMTCKRIPLPTILLSGEEGAWETLRGIILERIVPQLDALGIAVFQPPPSPLPSDVQMVPFHDIWVRTKPYPERFPQLAYVIAGHGEMILGDRWFTLLAGQGIFVPAGTPHAPHAMRNGHIVESDWLRILVYPFGIIVHRCRLTPSAHEKSVRHFIPNPTLSDLFAAWKQGIQQQPSNWRRHKSLLGAFLCLLAEATPVPINPMDLLPENFEVLPNVLRKALTALHSSFNQPFRLSALAERCFISSSHLCHLFREHLGTTPLGYLTHLRLTLARQLLEQVGLSVGDVAILVGYQDWRHFHRLFVRHFGVSPGAVRSKQAKFPHRVFKPFV